MNAKNAVKIGSRYMPCADIKEAVAHWENMRDSMNWGASESPAVTACIDKKLYRISYNGRVWDAGTGIEVIP